MKLLSVLVVWAGCLVPLHAANDPETRLAELRLPLPPVSSPVANYVPVVRTGNLLFLAGQISRDAQGRTIAGKVGGDLDVEQGAEAARRCALGLIAVLKAELGGLGRVRRIIRVGGFINSAPGFHQQPAVMNGCSDLLVAVFGEHGRHARTSVGVSELPAHAAVEVDLIVEITD
jgi:enamine deaminase RidA (YjgF/YER057c/UK114 family)